MWLYVRGSQFGHCSLESEQDFPYKKVEKLHAGYKNQMEFLNKYRYGMISYCIIGGTLLLKVSLFKV